MAILQCYRNVQGYCEQFQKTKQNMTQELGWGVGGAGSVHCAEVVALQRVKTQVACGEMQGFAVCKVSRYFQVNEEGPSDASLKFREKFSAYFAF